MVKETAVFKLTRRDLGDDVAGDMPVLSMLSASGEAILFTILFCLRRHLILIRRRTTMLSIYFHHNL